MFLSSDEKKFPTVQVVGAPCKILSYVPQISVVPLKWEKWLKHWSITHTKRNNINSNECSFHPNLCGGNCKDEGSILGIFMFSNDEHSISKWSLGRGNWKVPHLNLIFPLLLVIILNITISHCLTSFLFPFPGNWKTHCSLFSNTARKWRAYSSTEVILLLHITIFSSYLKIWSLNFYLILGRLQIWTRPIL